MAYTNYNSMVGQNAVGATTPIGPQPTLQEMAMQALNSLASCHGILDRLTNTLVGPDPGGPKDMMGLTGATLLIAETAGRLQERISELADRLGTV